MESVHSILIIITLLLLFLVIYKSFSSPLQDLFSFNEGTECDTHVLLGCQCDGGGGEEVGQSPPAPTPVRSGQPGTSANAKQVVCVCVCVMNACVCVYMCVLCIMCVCVYVVHAYVCVLCMHMCVVLCQTGSVYVCVCACMCVIHACVYRHQVFCQ